MSFIKRIEAMFRAGDDELGRDDLLREIAAGVLALRRHGARGSEVFPAEVLVQVAVAEGSLGPVRGFLAEPGFDRELEARLRNGLDDPKTSLPLRRYRSLAGERSAVVVGEVEARGGFTFLVSGGDRDGQRLVTPSGRPELRLGRGVWHGSDKRLRNDLVVSESDEFVSRRAAKLVRAGSALLVEALDQKECLAVERATGEIVRPAVTASGQAAARAGDVLVLDDGKGRSIRLLIEEAD